MALLPVGTNHDLHMSLGFALVACREERDMFMYLGTPEGYVHHHQGLKNKKTINVT
ncbi:hypothetical protein OsI_06360 [Oryza sativa Indica Group]|uniref:Uncharacterized protein n=1 Tax=Oryza sativa subsp. indica TaxID=39946 RepID=B8AE66_ORYSI|nr:hypothetical protein OsI_06360 [Oryza sativa Indica Group]